MRYAALLLFTAILSAVVILGFDRTNGIVLLLPFLVLLVANVWRRNTDNMSETNKALTWGVQWSAVGRLVVIVICFFIMIRTIQC